MYTDQQLNELKDYEKSIRESTPKALCNGPSVTHMRYIIRNLLDHIAQMKSRFGPIFPDK